MIKQFDKQNLAQVRVALDKALAQVQDEFGIKISVGSISFQANSFSTKLTAVVSAPTAATSEVDGNAKWQAAFHSHARFYGFQPSDLGRSVEVGGIKYIIVGMRPKARDKMVLQKPGGGFVAMSEELVKMKLS